jgi:hypothetical protein
VWRGHVIAEVFTFDGEGRPHPLTVTEWKQDRPSLLTVGLA